jgi:hypothetical protein
MYMALAVREGQRYLFLFRTPRLFLVVTLVIWLGISFLSLHNTPPPLHPREVIILHNV